MREVVKIISEPPKIKPTNVNANEVVKGASLIEDIKEFKDSIASSD